MNTKKYILCVSALLLSCSTSHAVEPTMEELGKQKIKAEIEKLKIEASKLKIDRTKSFIDVVTSRAVIIAAACVACGVIVASKKNCLGIADRFYSVLTDFKKYQIRKDAELADYTKCVQNAKTLGTNISLCNETITPALLAQQDAQISRYAQCLKNSNTLGADIATCNSVTPAALAQQEANVASKLEQIKITAQNNIPLGSRIYNGLISITTPITQCFFTAALLKFAKIKS